MFYSAQDDCRRRAARVMCAHSTARGQMPPVANGAWQPAGSLGSVRAGAASALLSDGACARHRWCRRERQPRDVGAVRERWNVLRRCLDEGGRERTTPPSPWRYWTAFLVVGGRDAAEALLSAEVYSSGGWCSAGDLTDARWGRRRNAGGEDGRVLIAGGENAAGVLSTVEMFDPGSWNLFSGRLALVGRKGHAAARIQDGRVVIAGGFTGESTLTSIDVFDPAAVSLSPLSVSLGTHRAGLSATTLLDGKVLFFGGNDDGNDLASSEILDPTAGTITAGASATPQAARRDHQAFLLPNNNTVLIVGGVTGNAPSTSAQLYLPWLNQFWQTGRAGRITVPGDGIRALQRELRRGHGGQWAAGDRGRRRPQQCGSLWFRERSGWTRLITRRARRCTMFPVLGGNRVT